MANIEKIKVGSTSYDVADTTARSSLAGKEISANKTTVLSSSSTDTQYPSAKVTYDTIQAAKMTASVDGKVLSIGNLSTQIATAIEGSY